MHYRLMVAERFAGDAELYEYIYMPMHLISKQTPNKNKIIIVPPVFIGGDEFKILLRLKELKRMGYTRALAHTIGHIPIIREAGMLIHGGFRLNITNSIAMKQYEELGLADSTVSIEMSLRRIKSLKSTIPRGFIAYGKLPMMLLRKIPDGNGLTDRKGKFMPLIRRKGEAELLNPNILVLSDKISDFDDLDFAVLILSPGESPKKVLDMYLNGYVPQKDFTRGLYYK